MAKPLTSSCRRRMCRLDSCLHICAYLNITKSKEMTQEVQGNAYEELVKWHWDQV